MLPPTASPKRIARSTAPLFSTGNVPGSARSTAETCVLGAAPNAVEAREKIFDAVVNCACVSSPMTSSQSAVIGVASALIGGSKAFWHPCVPIRHLLERIRHRQHARLVEIVAHDLQPDRPALGAEAARDRHAPQAREVDGGRVEVVQGTLHRILRLGPPA